MWLGPITTANMTALRTRRGIDRLTTPRDTDNPLFGGPAPVGIGVSGTFTDTRGTMSGTALVGKASLIFGATLHKLADIN